MRMAVSWAPALPAVLLCACLGWFPAPVPMTSMAWKRPAAAPHARCLVVFLPGMGDDAGDFLHHGFVADLRLRALSVDIVAADATIGYYSHGIFLDRLARDVVEPARARGYEQLWLIGNSLGGFGTLYYARAHAAEITGVLALAPYLGERDVIDEIYAQGGLVSWKGPPKVDAMTLDNSQREIWRWLQAVIRGDERGPNIYLGFGETDKLARADTLLAQALPEDHVWVIPGAHDWDTWHRLFDRFIQDSDFSHDCR
jgi:pimeloyl-ACP methyl ester carboxylesterase